MADRSDLSTANPAQGTVPIVGIGCSAGGLDALEKFFTHVPIGSGMAFVVVQHLLPNHTSALPDILQRFTSMTVVEASDCLNVQENHVYIIPPNRDLSLSQGALHLRKSVAPRGMHLPIDVFFKSLAEAQQEKAIGIILSGMGSDGTQGFRAIKDKNGLTLAQQPESAQADSMPKSAMNAGLVDMVATPEAMPGLIGDHLGYPLRSREPDLLRSAEVQNALDKVIGLLHEQSGNDFSQYKTNTLYRRIERRMVVHSIASMDDYVRYLRENPNETDLLFRELLIGVTNFYRDPDVWETLRTETFPALLEQHTKGYAFRAWVCACSTGEEAYSLAMTFMDVLSEKKPQARFSLQIYATDLDIDAVDKARKGLYPATIASNISAERLARYCTPENGGDYRIAKEIRDMVVFATQNVISDPPFTKLDILTCRNLLIYLGAQIQKKLIPLFHYALNRDGFLVLGSAETVGNFGHLFSPAKQNARIFRRLDKRQPMAELEFPRQVPTMPLVKTDNAAPIAAENLGLLADQFIQQNFAPPAVLVNTEGDILYVSGRTGKYLEVAAGKVNINIYALAREGLREALTGLIRRAQKELVPILVNGLRVDTNGGTQIVNLVVQAMDKPDSMHGRVLIVFKDVPTPPVRRRTSKGLGNETQALLMQELQQAREALQVTHEEMQTTVEELKSSNEELQSTNEELQSTNEEQTSSKEELQSLNEELQTVNAELQSKVDDLAWVHNDLTNLLNSTEIATVFLDSKMHLRRFTTYATKLFKLISGDVGRPLSDIVTDLDYPQLNEDSREVLRTLIFQEKVAGTHDGRWFRVRIMPYRTQDNMIDGVVITFIDITEIKLLEAKLRELKG
jgi:chemotaxis methyl-accepting protein methylase